MLQACIRLLGLVEIEQAGAPQHGFESRKALALLGYLMSKGQPLSRAHLIDLFWGEKTEARGRGNLSRVLNNLNGILPGVIHADRFSVEFKRAPGVWIDIDEFDRQAGQGDPQSRAQAVQLWRGDFMEGIYLDGCPEAEIWLVTEREHWRVVYAATLQALLDHYFSLGEYTQSLHYCSTLLELDPWREEVHRQRMELLARTGQRSAALKQWEQCRKVLAEELGVEPSHETRQLYLHLKNSGDRSRLVLPQPATLPPLVGRAAEMVEVYRLLASPACRLLTITGPGGIGKSRLGLEVAWQHRFSRLGGAAFVALAGAHTRDEVLDAIAAALELDLQGKADPVRQLVEYLSEKEVLLVLDNFEHLLNHGAQAEPAREARQIVSTLLEQAAGMKILATSRECLGLNCEWVFTLAGLPWDLNQSRPVTITGMPPAVELFCQRARQARSGFQVSAEETGHLAEICQLVEGNPLAIELAAALSKSISYRELASQIRTSLDVLTSPFPDSPERHKGLRLVFDQSWAQLSVQEKRVFQCLAVFEGGFRLEACQAVYENSAGWVGDLAAKSLIRLHPDGRYDLHQTLRQFAREKLEAQPGQAAETLDRHSRYYLTWLSHFDAAFWSGQPRTALEQVGAEIDNIRQAWKHALSHSWLKEIDSALESLFQFYDIRGWLTEGRELFGQAAAQLFSAPDAIGPDSPQLITRLRLRQAICQHRLGWHAEARSILAKCIEEFNRLGNKAEESLALYHLSFVCWWLGDYLQAEAYAGQSCEIARQNGDMRALAQGLNILGLVAEASGRYAQAQAYHQRSLAHFRQGKDLLWIAKTLNYLGIVSYSLGQYEQGVAYYQESLAVRRDLDDRRGVALTLTNLGNTYHMQKAYAEALECHQEALGLFAQLGVQGGAAAAENNLGNVLRAMGQFSQAVEHLERSLELKRKIGDRKGCANSLNNLGWIAFKLDDFARARRYFHEALSLALEVGAEPVALETARGAAALLAAEGHLESASTALMFIVDRPAADEDTRTSAAASLEALKKDLSEEVCTRLEIETQERTFETILAGLCGTMS